MTTEHTHIPSAAAGAETFLSYLEEHVDRIADALEHEPDAEMLALLDAGLTRLIWLRGEFLQWGVRLVVLAAYSPNPTRH